MNARLGSLWKLVLSVSSASRVLPACLVLAVLAGCSTGGDTAARSGPSSGATASPSSPAAAPSPSPSPTGLVAQGLPDVPAPNDLKPFTGPASDKWGADSVMAAYLFATDFVLDATFNPSLLALTEPRAIDMSAPEEGMTRECAARYRALTEKLDAQSGKEQDYNNVLSLSTWGATGIAPGSTVANPAYRDAGYGGATTAIGKSPEGQDALVLRFPVKGQILLNHPKRGPLKSEIAKDMTMTLVQSGNPARPWLVATYLADFVIGEPVPDPAR